jgi:hypothetical protein
MSLPAIRAACAAILKAMPPVAVNGTTIGMNQALAYQPQIPPEIVPCAWLGRDTFEIEMGALEVWTHNVPVTVAVHEAGSSEMEWLTVEAFMLAVMVQIRAHQGMNDTCVVFNVTGGEEGQIVLQGKTYHGFTLTTAIVEKFEVANQIAS